jgi:hypothetical protein
VKVNEEYVEGMLRVCIARYTEHLQSSVGQRVLDGDLDTAAATYQELQKAEKLIRSDLRAAARYIAGLVK